MLIVEYVSIQLTEWSNTLLLHFLCNLAELMEKFQSALYRHYVSGVLSLYRSDDMQALCETHAPHLFYILISTIVSADRHPTSERHSHLQQQRIVVLLHMLPYFRYLLISEHRKACFTPNHFCHQRSQGSHLTCLYLLQSRDQSQQQTPSVAQQQFSNLCVPPQST